MKVSSPLKGNDLVQYAKRLITRVEAKIGPNKEPKERLEDLTLTPDKFSQLRTLLRGLKSDVVALACQLPIAKAKPNPPSYLEPNYLEPWESCISTTIQKIEESLALVFKSDEELELK